jgi:hypothetical protein
MATFSFEMWYILWDKIPKGPSKFMKPGQIEGPESKFENRFSLSGRNFDQ